MLPFHVAQKRLESKPEGYKIRNKCTNVKKIIDLRKLANKTGKMVYQLRALFLLDPVLCSSAINELVMLDPCASNVLYPWQTSMKQLPLYNHQSVALAVYLLKWKLQD